MPRRKPTEIDKKFGKLIAEMREKTDKTQEEIAEHVDLTYQQIGKYERGESAMTIGLYYDLRAIIGGPDLAGFAEPQTIYQASDQNLADIEDDLEALLAKVRKRAGR